MCVHLYTYVTHVSKPFQSGLQALDPFILTISPRFPQIKDVHNHSAVVKINEVNIGAVL
jgi:hypothetical protein